MKIETIYDEKTEVLVQEIKEELRCYDDSVTRTLLAMSNITSRELKEHLQNDSYRQSLLDSIADIYRTAIPKVIVTGNKDELQCQ